MKNLFLIGLMVGIFFVAAGATRDTGAADQILWSRGPDIPLPRGGYYASWFRGGLLIAGGTYWKDNKKLWSDSVHFYDPSKRTWAEWPPLPMPLAYGLTAQVDGRIYLISGMKEDKLSLDIFRLDGRQWTRIGAAPAGFIYGAAAVVGKKIYAIGGGSSNNDLTTATSQVWVFDPTKAKWEQLESFPGRPRVVHTVAAMGNAIFLFGGATQPKGGPLEDLSDAYRFDTITRKWTALKSLPRPSRASWATVANGSIFLIGGSAERPQDTVYNYLPETDEYRLVSHLPSPLLDSKFFFHDGVFYGATGEDKGRSRFPGLYIGRLVGSDKRKPGAL
jgi:N-acetylneuraminic acid mutarotase